MPASCNKLYWFLQLHFVLPRCWAKSVTLLSCLDCTNNLTTAVCELLPMASVRAHHNLDVLKLKHLVVMSPKPVKEVQSHPVLPSTLVDCHEMTIEIICLWS